MWSRHVSALCLLIAAGDDAALEAQTAQTPFTFEVQIREQSATVGLGGTITFPATAIGQSSQATFRINNKGTGTWTLRRAGMAGTGFAASVAATPILAGGQSAFVVTFTPTSTAVARAVLTLTLDGPEGQTSTPFFSLSGTGGDESVAVSFLANSSANPVTIGASDTIRMSVLAAGSRQTATVILSNRAGSAVPIQDLRVSGNDAFELGGLPVLPANLGPGGELRFFLVFAPNGRGPFDGQLSLTISGTTRVIPVRGELSSANFQFERIIDTSAVALDPDATIELPAVAVAAPRTLARVRIRNAGSLAGRINTLAVTGAAFALVDPPTLPVTLAVGDSIIITLAFAPKEPGVASGRLTVEDVGFPLSGNALGGRFGFTLSFGETQTEIFQDVTALLPNTSVGSRLPFTITVRNTGNQTSVVTLMAVTGSGFSLVRTPPLPGKLEPGATMSVEAVFAPSSVGVSDGRFQIDQLTIPLRGAGNAPPAVSTVKFLNVNAKMEALQQPDVGLELAAAYAYDVIGRLSLAFAPENFIDDPAVQFVSGSRAIDFRIPAGSTRAVFPNGKQEIRMQTGSSAGVITLAAAMTVSGVAVTSSGSLTQDIAIAAAAPVIRVMQLGTRTTSRIDLVINGASTARSVTRINLTLNPSVRSNLQTTKLTVNVESAFKTWYESSSSRPLGSQFSATIRLDINGDVRAIDSITASLENARGVSAAKQISLSAAE